MISFVACNSTAIAYVATNASYCWIPSRTTGKFTMDEHDDQKGVSPKDVRHALRGWGFFFVLMTAIFGVAYVLVEM